MNKLFLIIFACFLAASLNSCVVLSTKKFNALVAQRDSLSAGWDQANVKIGSLEEEVQRLKADTSRMNSRIAELESKVSGLDKNYALLRANSSSEINKLSEDLKKREARLKEVEEALRKRDAATNALKEKLQQALLGFKQSGLSVDIRDGKVYVSLTDKLLFSSGSIIIDEKGKQALAELAKVLKTQPDINISVEGHTDNQKVVNLGQIKDNWDLSVLRATSVVRYLTEVQKIENNRITATGKGQYQPIDAANTPEARSHNRRIEIVLSPKLDELYNLIK
ncbi:OmpA family protein (plasmid) [Pedobacter sp. BS3]|uniref:OmpA/MotB family protein n=1 Tax=Pedobacter sp. BS3 TaxID=2567937 RepID=UPI0011EFBB75|nr:flagellar motor protein MotB [Pedobacter sp. BS3]TZF85521.1 OmpA family protein [Pedobacter sp. BS3]